MRWRSREASLALVDQPDADETHDYREEETI